MTKAENIRNQCMKILDKYDADYRGVTVDRIDGTTYVIFKYYGGTNDTVDRNDDSWDEIFELDGVVDIGYGEGYGIEGKYEDSLLIELDKDIVESKKSTRKPIEESADDNWYKLKMLNEMLDAMEEDEYNIPKLGIYGVTKNISLDKGAIEALIKYYK